MNNKFLKLIVATNDPLNRFYVGWASTKTLDKYVKRKNDMGNFFIQDTFVAENLMDLSKVISTYGALPNDLHIQNEGTKELMRGMEKILGRPNLHETGIVLDKITSVSGLDKFRYFEENMSYEDY